MQAARGIPDRATSHYRCALRCPGCAASDFLRSNDSPLCFGGGSFKADEPALMEQHPVTSDRVIYIDRDDALPGRAYRRAQAFVNFSLYEGFGIHPVEALSVGCPVICSTASLLPVIVGDRGQYIDAEAVDPIFSALERVMGSADSRRALIGKGQGRSGLFGRLRCSDEALAVYRRLL